MPSNFHDRIHGGLLGLAVGDSVGYPADFHRTIRSPWMRSRLWAGSAELDEQQVSKPLLPFVLNSSATSPFEPTDDTEAAVLALRIALDSVDESPERAFEAWKNYTSSADVWSGVAERSAIINASRGLCPPQTGQDNPAAFSDSAVPSGVVFGLIHAGSPDAAADAAAKWASITHAQDGIWAASVMAAAIALIAAGEDIEPSLDYAERFAPIGSWLSTNFTRSREVLEFNIQPFNALPSLLSALSPRQYSHGGVAPESLPLAFAVVRLTTENPELTLPFALSIARHADSVPAFVGAIAGTARGALSFGEQWPATLDRVVGLFYPALANESLSTLAQELIKKYHTV